MNENIDIENIQVFKGTSLGKQELKERLKLMGIQFHTGMNGKKYFVDLYDKALEIKENRLKIANLILEDTEESKMNKRDSTNKDDLRSQILGDSEYDKFSKLDIQNIEREKITSNNYFSLKDEGKFTNSINRDYQSYGRETKDSSLTNYFDNTINDEEHNINQYNADTNNNFEYMTENVINNSLIVNEKQITEQFEYNENKGYKNITNNNNNQIYSSFQINISPIKTEEETDLQHKFTKIPFNQNKSNPFLFSKESILSNTISTGRPFFTQHMPTIDEVISNKEETQNDNKDVFLTNNNDNNYYYPPSNSNKNKIVNRLIIPLACLLLIWFAIIISVQAFSDNSDYKSVFTIIQSSLQMPIEQWLFLVVIILIFIIINKRNNSNNR